MRADSPRSLFFPIENHRPTRTVRGGIAQVVKWQTLRI